MELKNKLQEWAPRYLIMILGNVLMGLDSCNRPELTTIEQSLKFEEHTASVALELKQIYSSPTVALIKKK